MERLILSLLFWLAISGSATAQDSPTLLVTLKDIASHPIAGARVIVRNSAGDRDIVRATTDAQGVASFAVLMESDIRIAIEGQLPGGAKLYQPGNDARGMLVFLQAPTTHVNLLADVDGLIAPDPLTMLALEPGVPVATVAAAVFPTAPVAAMPTVTAIQARAQPTFLTGRAANAGTGGDAGTEASPAPGSPILIWFGIALLIGSGIGILLLLRPWR